MRSSRQRRAGATRDFGAGTGVEGGAAAAAGSPGGPRSYLGRVALRMRVGLPEAPAPCTPQPAGLHTAAFSRTDGLGPTVASPAPREGPHGFVAVAQPCPLPLPPVTRASSRLDGWKWGAGRAQRPGKCSVRESCAPSAGDGKQNTDGVGWGCSCRFGTRAGKEDDNQDWSGRRGHTFLSFRAVCVCTSGEGSGSVGSGRHRIEQRPHRGWGRSAPDTCLSEPGEGGLRDTIGETPSV